MIKRLTKPEYICYLALAAASRSEDVHTRVGGALVDHNWRVLNTSYNGYKAGMPIPDRFLLEENRAEKARYILHAEENLFNYYHGSPFAIGLTMSPCEKCSKLIVAHGVSQVFYIKDYQNDKEKFFKKIFDFYGIEYFRLTNANIKNILRVIEEDKSGLEKLLDA